MRVLVAPDKFAGTLTAVEAAEAVARGWRRTSPADDLVLVPMSDGGPGFVDVMHNAHGGQLLSVTVRGALGERVPAAFLHVDGCAYVESAQACGLDLLPRQEGAPRPGVAEDASTYGVGELIGAAIDAGAHRVVVGLGGSGTNDGGAGMLAALGATSEPPGALTAGATGLEWVGTVDLEPARQRTRRVELVAAADVDNPLLGLRGATNVFGPQKGIQADRLIAVDGALTRWAYLAGRAEADRQGAGAAGGLGYALALLGATPAGGLSTVADAVGLPAAVQAADLVVTGEGRLDWQSMAGKVVAGVARMAAAAMTPCIVLAGEVLVGNRELRANGIEAAYGMVDVVGRQASLARPDESLTTVAARVARTWSRR